MEGMREEGIKQDTYRQAQGPPHPVASRQPEQDQAEQITVILITLNIEPCNIQETVNRASESAQSPKYQMAAAIAHSAKTHESQNNFGQQQNISISNSTGRMRGRVKTIHQMVWIRCRRERCCWGKSFTLTATAQKAWRRRRRGWRGKSRIIQRNEKLSSPETRQKYKQGSKAQTTNRDEPFCSKIEATITQHSSCSPKFKPFLWLGRHHERQQRTESSWTKSRRKSSDCDWDEELSVSFYPHDRQLLLVRIVGQYLN